MAKQSNLQIRSSWEYNEQNNSVIRTSIFEQEYSGQKEDDTELCHSSELAPMVLCRPENQDESCTVSFYCDSCNNIGIKRLSILSSNKTVEVYHNTEGYMFCMRGSAVQTDSEELLYNCSTNMDFSSRDIQLKFPVKQDVNVIRIYQVNLEIQISEEVVPQDMFGTRSIDLDKVKSYLGDIPESAKGLFQNMEAYQKHQQSMQSSILSGSSLGNFGMMGLMSALMGSMGSKIGANNTAPLGSIGTKMGANNTSPQGSVGTKIGANNTAPQGSVGTKIGANNTAPLGSAGTKMGANFPETNTNRSVESEVQVQGSCIQQDNESTCRSQDDQSSDSGIERESISPESVSQTDVLSQLMNKMPSGGQGDGEMYKMLKNICGSVSSSRTAVNKDTDREDQESSHMVDTIVKEKSYDDRTDIREIIEDQLQRTEERLKTYIDNKLNDIEKRFNEKLDRILTHLTKCDDNKPP